MILVCNLYTVTKRTIPLLLEEYRVQCYSQWELVATKMSVEAIMELRYQLRGVPVNGPSMLYGDNMSMVLSTTIPSSILKKKMLVLCYHWVREAIAAGIIVYQHIQSKQNKGDLLTKPIGGTAFHQLVKGILFSYHIKGRCKGCRY